MRWMPPSPASSAKTASSIRASIAIPCGLTVTTVLSIIGLVGAAIGAIGSLRAAFRALADKLTDDVFWIWVIVRNLIIAIGIGAAFAASAVITFYANAGIGALSQLAGAVRRPTRSR